ncbi:MAG: peptidylprolyl isomerase [Actinomycetota bacterium]|nr:peptidylprolyl isomerase [Actinomycetota bacterium]
MSRSLRWVVLALAMVALACAQGGQVVATVNGEPVYLSDVSELRPEVTVASEEFRQDLFRVIAQEALVQELEDRFGTQVDEERVEANLEELERQIETEQGTSVEEFLESQGATREVLRRVALEQALRQAVDEQLAADQEEPTEEELRASYEEALADLTTVCARHILVETEEEAQQAKARLEDGEDFAEVADEVSLDEASEGGELPCTSAATYAPEFAQAVLEAPIGELVGPVRTQFGWHVIEVSSRDTPVFEDVRQQLAQQLSQQRAGEAFQEFFLQALGEAEVEIEERYGTWSTDPVPRVLAPEGADDSE